MLTIGRSPADRKGRSDLTHIFDRLRDQQVRRILKVTVYNDESPCHTDAAIVKCLEGFGVEIWNWIRIDLPSDVISRASKELHHISLYCSGNHAVLRGWSAKGGFGDPAKFPKVS